MLAKQASKQYLARVIHDRIACRELMIMAMVMALARSVVFGVRPFRPSFVLVYSPLCAFNAPCKAIVLAPKIHDFAPNIHDFLF